LIASALVNRLFSSISWVFRWQTLSFDFGMSASRDDEDKDDGDDFENKAKGKWLSAKALGAY